MGRVRFRTFSVWALAAFLPALALPADLVVITPSSPTDESELHGICYRTADPLSFQWLVNDKIVRQGELARLAAIRCESADELRDAGAANVKAIPIVAGRHGSAAYISENHPLVLPAERYIDQRQGGIAFWFKPKWSGDDDLRHPLFYASGGPDGLRIFIEKEPEPHRGLVFCIREPNGRRHAVWTAGKALKQDEWYYIACFWQLQEDGSDNCRMMMFFNRSLVSSTPVSPEAITPGEPPKRIIFGSSPAGGPGDVIIDEIRFFSRPPADARQPLPPEETRVFVKDTLPCTALNPGDAVTFAVFSGENLVGKAETRIARAEGPRDVFGGLRAIAAARKPAFYTEKLGKIWWTFTPKGNAFFAVGADHVSYKGHWCQKLGYSPYNRNVEAKYGDEEGWAQSALQRLKDWNFNLLTAGHSLSLRYRGIPHTEFLSLGAGYAAKDDIVPKTTWTGFPNVFDPGFEEYCDKVCASRCRRNAEDPWLFGYFIDNELEWYGKSRRESGLFEEAMKKPANHSAKRALMQFLQARYKKIADFNSVWGTSFGNFEDLADVTQPPMSAHQRAVADQRAFVRLVAERYFAVTTAAIRKYDPNHLILGCRFAGRAPDIWDICGKYCDIVTVNYYGRVNLETEEAGDVEAKLAEWHKASAKPLMLTEWSFPALDSGLPCLHGAGQRFDTQAQKTRAFDIYQRAFFRLPFMVGSDYFMWADEPALGISDTFPEDSNYGLVNENDEPYAELTAKARALNPQVFDIHSGRAALLSIALKAKDARLEVRVRNSGGQTAKTGVAITVDGEKLDRPIEVGPGKTETLWLEIPRLGTPGGHLISAVVDPDGALAQAGRQGNRASLVSFIKPKQEPKPLAYVVVSNPTDENLDSVPVTLMLDKIAPDWARLGRSTADIRVEDLEGRPVPHQVDTLAKGLPFPPGIPSPFPTEAELAVLASVPPRSCQTLAVMYKTDAPKPAPSPLQVKSDGVAFTVDNGLLRLERGKTGGNLLDKVSLGGVELGLLRPLMWLQADGRDHWVSADAVEQVNIVQGPVRALIEITASSKEKDKPSYRCKYRLSLYPGKPRFTSRLLAVENTSQKPWTLRSYFHYATSNIGGARQDDEPALKVPNYYLKLGVWGDEKVGAYYGVIPPAQEDCSAHFWTDQGAPLNQHPDARRALDVTLLPGMRHEAPEPPFVVFGAKKEAAGVAWAPITARLRAIHQLSVQIHKPGWFW